MEMGIGKLGAPSLIIKRKFRWTLRIQPMGESGMRGAEIPASYVKVSARPQLEIDETEIHYLNGITYIPGKGKWSPLNVTYVDVASSEMLPLYNWLVSVYDFTSENLTNDIKQSEKSGWNAEAYLSMYDGCGQEIDRWTLKSCWPQSINFGELDYEDSGICTIDLSLRYSEARYESICGMGQPSVNCSSCKIPTPQAPPPIPNVPFIGDINNNNGIGFIA